MDFTDPDVPICDDTDNAEESQFAGTARGDGFTSVRFCCEYNKQTFSLLSEFAVEFYRGL